MCKACNALMSAIDRYIAKADNDLVEKLKKAGFILPEETIAEASNLEESLAGILKKQTKMYTSKLKSADDVSAFLHDMFDDLKKADKTEVKLAEAFIASFSNVMPKVTTAYLQTYDKEMELVKITEKTNYYVHSNAEWVSKKMKLDSQNKLEKILNDAMDDGSSVQQVTKKILDEGIRDERYRARSVALTEMLRTHSYAADEALMQTSVVEDKEWVHTGSKNNNARANHEAMSGVTVHKEEPFELYGSDGIIYYPMFPRDTCLPASETVNCRCLHRGIVSKDALGVDVEERRRMQREYIESADRAWEKELDKEHHARAIDWRKERGLKYAPL